MRYIIAHLIEGEAKQRHEALTAELVEEFDIFPLHERIPPHLTLKRWWHSEDVNIQDVYKVLDEFAATQPASPYKLADFGSFRDDVIYVDVQPSATMCETAQELIKALHKVPNLTFDEYDNGGDFHATVALGALKSFEFQPIWNYLQTIEQPNFNMSFDNIATLKRTEDVWEVDRVWKLN